MIELRFSELHTDRTRYEHPADVFVGITADFAIVVSDSPVYHERDFPVIELAAELRDWIDTGFAEGTDFDFDSMSTPDAGWVWIRRVEDGWRIGSIHQERADPLIHGEEVIRSAVRKFIESVQVGAHDLGADVSRYLRADPQ